MAKYKIAHIQVLPIFSGVQKAMYDILIRLDRTKYDISVICHSEGELTEILKKARIKCIILNELKREINLFYDLLVIYKLYKLFKSEKYDLVHTHSSKPGIVGRIAAKIAGVKCIVHTVQGFAFHEQSSKLTCFIVGLIERLTALVTDKVIFVNNKDRIVASEMNLMKSNKMITIYNGINLDYGYNLNDKTFVKNIAGLNGCSAIIGMVARLWKQKDPHNFIRAIPVIINKLPDAKFLLIGDGPLKHELVDLSKKLGVYENVLFLGWRKDVKKLIHIFDIMVLTSLWEGLPLTILEGMALSKPIVATNIKGNNELVVHGKTGYLATPGDYTAIGEYCLKLLNDKKLSTAFGINGYNRVKENYCINKTLLQINKEYNYLLNRN